jgi:hypothetical protein
MSIQLDNSKKKSRLIEFYLRRVIRNIIQESPEPAAMGRFAAGFKVAGDESDYKEGYDDFASGRRIAVYTFPPNEYHLKPRNIKRREKELKAPELFLTRGQCEWGTDCPNDLGPADKQNGQYMKGWLSAAHRFSDFEYEDPDGEFAEFKMTRRKKNKWLKDMWKLKGNLTVPLGQEPNNAEGSLLYGDKVNPLFGKDYAWYGHIPLPDWYDPGYGPEFAPKL